MGLAALAVCQNGLTARLALLSRLQGKLAALKTF
jgi:hypothetical protein